MNAHLKGAPATLALTISASACAVATGGGVPVYPTKTFALNPAGPFDRVQLSP